MNRPFSAFGVLLSLLAVTMFAVSSTSRSTTVKPAAEHTKRAALRRPMGYPPFDVAVAADRDGQDEGLCAPGLIDEAATAAASDTATEVEGKASTLAPVQIEAIENDVSWVIPEPMDGRSLYDTVYDWVVFGSRAVADEAETKSVSVEPIREMSDVEMTGLFQSLLSEGRESVQGTTQRLKQDDGENGQLRAGTMLPAFQNWVQVQVEGMLAAPQQNETVGWDDYADMVDSAMVRQSTSTVVASISVDE